MDAASYAQGPGDTRLLTETIGQVFSRVCDEFPDRDALIVAHQDIHWTYAQYREQVDCLATGLLALGFQRGDRVGIWAPNRYEWCLVQFATARIGVILVNINPAYRLHELEYALNKVQCRGLVTAESFKTSHYLDMLCELAPELHSCDPGGVSSQRLPYLETVIRMGDEKTPGMFNFGQVCGQGAEAQRQALADLEGTLRADEAINIQFTSGTTGNPKGATLTHANILNNGFIVGEGMGLTEEDRLCIPVPLYHCFGMVMGNLACVTHGAAAVFPSDAFEPGATLEAVQRHRCTGLHGVPTMFIAELDSPEFANYELGSLRTGIMAGAPCPVEVMKRVIGDMHMSEVLIAYGQTECSPVNHMTAADDPLEKRIETVGRAGPHLEIKLIDDRGEPVARGERGEICCRGYAVMQGYWDDEERTRETIDADAWLHSGDLGVMDDEGYVQVVGRIKDMIIRGGENIYPREVEEFLYTHPDIQEAQVFGVPDEKYGEQVCAWVQLRPGTSMDGQALQSYCRDRVAHFKVPRYIRFVEEYPMTVTGKIQKFRMREAMAEELGL